MIGRNGDRFLNIHPVPVPSGPVVNGATTTEQSLFLLQLLPGPPPIPNQA